MIQLDPKNAWAYCNRGLAWFEQRDYDRALADLDRAIRLDPGSPWSYSNRGMVWYEKKAYDKAVSDLERAAGSTPITPTRSTVAPGSGRRARCRSTATANAPSSRPPAPAS